MAKQTIRHGAEVEMLTPTEAAALIQTALADRRFRENRTRIRVAATIKLDGTGSGVDEVYNVPVGYEFEARRLVVDLDTAADPSTGNVPLNVAGKTLELLRAGTRIEYLAPVSPNITPQIPGRQDWGSEEGPYFRNGEVVEVRAKGLTANATLDVSLEGILRRPENPKGDRT